MMARWGRFGGIVLCVFLLVACSSPEEKKARFCQKGKTLLEQGDLAKARLEFKNAIQIDPKYAAAYHMLGKVELEDKKVKQAFGYFSKAAELDAGLLEAHVEIGKIMLMARQVVEARSKMAYVLDKQPGHQGGRLLEAGVLLAEKKPEAAKKRLDALLAAGVTDPQAYLMLASIRMKAGDAAGGMAVLRNGIAANTDNIRLRTLLTAILTKEKQYDAAVEVVKEAIAIEPEEKAHKLKLADVYWKSGRTEEAKAFLEKRIAEEKDPIVMRILSAEFYARRNDADKALAVINEGITKHAESINLRLALARIQLSMRENDIAIETLRAALGLAKDNAAPDLLKVKNQLARLHLAKGEIDTAKRYTDEVLAVSGSNVDAQLTAGQIYLKQKDGLNAVSAFRTVVAEKPDAVNAYLHLAQAHLLNDEKQLVIDTLTNGLKINPASRFLRRALARAYAAENNFSEAEKALRLIVEQHPKDLRARGELADFLFARKRPDEAIDIYERMVAEYSRIAAGYLKLAALYRAQKNPTAARAILEKGNATIPQSPLVLTSLAKTYLDEGDSRKAIDLVQNRIKADEKDIIAHNLLGEIYHTQKQYAKAQRAFETAITIKPEWQVPHNNLARIFLLQGKKDEAIIRLTTALKNNPKNAAAYMTLGYLYINDDQEEKAAKIYEQALEAIPDLWAAANNLACILSIEGNAERDLDRAYELALKAIKLQPERPDVIDTLGWVYYLRGETDLAIAELEKAIERAPDSAIINYHMGMVLVKTNRLDEARERLKKAVAQEDFSEREAAKKALKALPAG